MRMRTVACLALLIFAANAFTVTLTLPELVEESPPRYLFIDDFGRIPFLLGDGVGGGPGGGGDK